MACRVVLGFVLVLHLDLVQVVHPVLGLLSRGRLCRNVVVGCVVLGFVGILRRRFVVVEVPLGAFVVPEVREGHVVDAQLELVAVLDDVQRVLLDVEGELEGIFEF